MRELILRALAHPHLASARSCFPAAVRYWVRAALEKPLGKAESLRFRRTVDWHSHPAQATVQNVVRKPVDDLDRLSGINLYGYFSRWLGLGECARLYANAMLESSYPVALYDVDINIPHARLDTSLAAQMVADSSFTSDMIFVNPDHWQETLQSIDRVPGIKRYVIGYWFWELENFPEEWIHALDQVDEIMVSSAYIEQSVRRICSKPVTRVPLPMMLSADSGLQRRHFGLDEEDYVFFCSFDFNSTIARKNPHAVVEAFRLAFPLGNEKVALLIKSSNGDQHALRLKELVEVASKDRRITIRDDMLERRDLQALHRCSDVYVSLHRSEGFGLGLAEAMCMGKVVVATGYSGNMEFMTSANSCLVDYRMVPVLQGEYPYAKGQHWADPDPQHAAHHLRALYLDRAMARSIGLQASQDMARNFSVEACMNVLAQRLRLIDLASDDPA